MTTHCALLYVPGWPFDAAALQPKTPLAVLAGQLRARGHSCALHDYGTLNFLRESLSADLVNDLQTHLWRLEASTDPTTTSLTAAWHLRQLDTRLAQALQRAHERVAREVLSDAQESVVLLVDRPADLAPAVATAQALRVWAPGTRIVCWSPSLADLANTVIAEMSCFDCFATGSAADVVDLVSSPQQRETWALVPGLTFRDGRCVRGTMPVSWGTEAMPSNGFAPSTYPAMADGGKFRVITLDLAPTYGPSAEGEESEAERAARHATCLAGEIGRLSAETGVTFFHLCGQALPGSYVEALAHTLLHRGLSIRYSHTGRVESATPAAFYLLWASGCRAIDFRIDTGSQLLLDRVYRRSVGVTRMEEVLKSCRGAGITTSVGLTYPCPFDDYNTRAETLRLIERTQPDGAYVGLPEPLPGSAWFANPAAFGFSRCSAGSVVRRWLAAQAAPASSALLPAALGRGRRDSRRAVLENGALQRDLQELKVAVPLDGRLALMAQPLGYDGRERELAEAMHRALLCGDADVLAGFVERFNGATASPATAGAGPLRRLQNLAVGN
jgi:hypothetical protein